jgi:hypothetical protein
MTWHSQKVTTDVLNGKAVIYHYAQLQQNVRF